MMRYFIYTDGSSSYEKATASSAYMIITDSSFIESKCVRLDEGAKSNEAELTAILLGARAVQGYISIYDSVTFITDSKLCLNLVNNIVRGVHNDKQDSLLYRDVKKELLSLKSKASKISVLKVKAHKKDTVNPNRLVDLLARKESR